MPIETFRTNFPDVPHRISGATLNRQNSMLNAIASGFPIGMDGINTTGIASSAKLIPRIGTMIITNAADTCAANYDEPDNKGFPCYSSKKYLGKFRRYKSGASSGEWLQTDEEEHQVDMAPWWPPDAVTGPILLVDDIISVRLDEMRGCFVPIHIPTEWFGKTDEDIDALDTGTVSVWKRNSSGTLVDTGRDIPHAFSPAIDIEAGSYVAIAWVSNTMWCTPMQC